MGDPERRPSYRLSRWLFLRLLGLVFLIAFVSLWVQVHGLVGAQGILPLGEFLERVHERFGSDAFRMLPTLTWLSHSDAMLHALCAAGVVLSLLLMAGVAPLAVLFGAWATYLSLQIAAQVFLGYQWDILLLETAFCALFWAPLGLKPRGPGAGREPHPAGRWLLWLLLFKFMVLSGAVKLVSLDATWWGLTALDFHYFTTCLPLWTGWFAQKLPEWVQKLSVLVMFVVEIGVPFLIFGPPRLRRTAAFALIALQAGIAATGNYGFFNLLSMALCLPLLDDAVLERFIPARWRMPPPVQAPQTVLVRIVPWALVTVILLASTVSFVEELVRTRPSGRISGVPGALLDAGQRYVVQPGMPLLALFEPTRSINGYGLFRSMTTRRPEIVIEASMDGKDWREWEFRWKPGNLYARPRLVAPHMPRLDWQMWFAALNPRGHQYWMQPLLVRLLEGTAVVEALLGPRPFDAPPRYLRLAYYDYEFTSPDERRATGAWWRRQFRGYLTQPLEQP